MSDPVSVDYLFWVRLGAVASTLVLSILWALRASRPRHVRPVPAFLGVMFSVVAAILAMRLLGVGVSIPVVVGSVVAGGLAGALAGRAARMGVLDGRAVVKPSRALAWVSALVWVTTAAAAALAGPGTASVTLALLVGVIAMGFAESVTHVARARVAS